MVNDRIKYANYRLCFSADWKTKIRTIRINSGHPIDKNNRLPWLKAAARCSKTAG